MSTWIQSGISVSVAIVSYVWIWCTRKREEKREVARIGWMPIALFLALVLYGVGFSLYLGAQFAWVFTSIIVVLAVLFRVFMVPRLREKPSIAQGILEVSAERAAPVKKERTLKSAKRLKLVQNSVFLVSLWFTFGRVLMAIYGTFSGEMEFVLFPQTIRVFGIPVSQSTIDVWAIIGVMAALAVLFRLFVVPRFQEKPRGLQNLVELSIEAIDKFTHGRMHGASDSLTCYMLTIATLMIGSAMVELLGIRPPTADLKLTFSMALITFVMINYYGFKQKGVLGRFKSLAQPKVFLLPIRVLTDLAIPISLSCRLFGNMLGGLIVMDLLKMALGTNAIGIPSVAGLYFNIFHPLIQTYIFITLSLTFINEAVE